MDKGIIKTYAVEARRKLIEAVKLKAQQLYIFEDSAKTLRSGTENDRLKSDGVFLSPEQLQARERLCGELLHEGSPYKPAIYNRVMENIACTWFNRLIALRIMEVNDWLPSNIRILSSREPGRVEPDAMREVERLDYVKQTKVVELLKDEDINAAEKLYKYILISQCNALSKILPGMFEKENDYTELLLPDALLAKGGVVSDFVNRIHEDNFNVSKQGQIEIIGWLYQYYISEKKDEVFAGLKKNIKINKDTIPAATQLFTPEWIVKYMVENSLGRLWLESHPNAELRANWKYYVDEAEQEPEVAAQLLTHCVRSSVKRPEDIKLIDPCMGSGHILVYTFEVLFQIYRSEGYSERDIPNLILQNNLYGLDIDDRAGQLAYFSLMIKARSYNRRFFRQESIPQPMVYAVPETKVYIIGLKKWLGASMTESEREVCFEDLAYLGELFSKGKEYGSAMKIEREIDYARLREYVRDCAAGQITIGEVEFMQQTENLDRLIDVAVMLTQKYDVVVTNPPYMGGNGMGAVLSDYIKKSYPNSKSDMSTVLMERTLELCKPHGYMSMINIPVWMFLSSYEKLREELLSGNTFINLLHMGRGVFGADFGTTTFVIKASRQPNYIGLYRKLYSRQGAVDSMEKKLEFFFSDYGKYLICQDDFSAVPGATIAYSASKSLLSAFKYGKRIDSFADPKQGLATADNDRFIRLWHEVSIHNCGFLMSQEQVSKSKLKWFPYNKGGGFKKWYGNNEYLVNWENNGLEIRNIADDKGNIRSRVQNTQFYFHECLTWCKVTISGFSMRYIPVGFIFDVAGCSLFNTKERTKYVLGFANSKVNAHILAIISPTVNYEVGHVASLPIVGETNERIEELVAQNIDISRADWDSYETSWDFKRHPLMQVEFDTWVRNGKQYRLKDVFSLWDNITSTNFDRLKSNEEELNRIFIDIYGLQDELAPDVDDDHITISRADLARDVRSFISYAVGCMFGRYSLDEPGLVFAGGDYGKRFGYSTYPMTGTTNAGAGRTANWQKGSAHIKKNDGSVVECTFSPEDDNIIPIGSADYFDDDIVVRFIEFVRAVYGDETLGVNLNFIADALYPSGNGTAQERIRRYFLNDFYKDHVKVYQKRPIYWLFDSGRKDGFKALFYLHRYDKYTVARARTDYLHPLQRKYDAEIKRLEMLSGSTDNAREKAAYRKEVDVLLTKMDECRVYDQVVSHIAHQQIELDLDDGVKVNYEKFQGVEVPMDNGKTVTMDLLAKI